MVGVTPDDATAIRVILANYGIDAAHAALRSRLPWMTDTLALATLNWLGKSVQPQPDVLKGWARRRGRGLL